jgi:hypothetical protein
VKKKKIEGKFSQKVYGVNVLIGLLLADSLWSAIRNTALPRKVLAALFRF